MPRRAVIRQTRFEGNPGLRGRSVGRFPVASMVGTNCERNSATKNFAELLGPAIQYAEDGLPVTEVIGGYWRAGERALQRDPGSAKIFLIDGHAPESRRGFQESAPGRKLSGNRGEGGRDGYYNGPIVEKLVAFSQKDGGLFAMKDFADTQGRLDRAGLHELSRLRRLGIAAERTGNRRAANVEHPGRIRPEENGAELARILASC